MSPEVTGLLDLEGRTILIVGASSGIGKATAQMLAGCGAKLILSGRNMTTLRVALVSLDGEGHTASEFDITNLDAVPAWLKTIARERGALHGLVHCAGNHMLSPLQAMKMDALESLIKVNISSAVAVAKGFRQKSVCAKGSCLIFISSVLALVGTAGASAYGATKGAINSLVKGLAIELASEEVRVNAVAPGLVRGELTSRMFAVLSDEQQRAIKAMHPLGLGDPRDVAGAIAFLLADTGRWITGTTLVVDGGYTAH